MRKIASVLLVLVSALLLAACATQPKVRVDKDTHTDFSAYKTFGWFTVEGKPGAVPIDSLAAQRVHAAVTASLQAKGYVFDDANPDFRVSHLLVVYERAKQSGMRIGVGAGGGGGNVAGGVGLSIPVGKRTESVATLTIDAIDAARKAQVWTGTYELLIADKDVSDANAEKLVATILEKFPAR